MEYLKGGRKNQIRRIKNTVCRPTGFWSASVHQLLMHLSKNNFESAPEFIGLNDKGNEILSYLPGEVSNSPLSEVAASRSVLVSAARLLRGYHDATVSFVADNGCALPWMLPAQDPPEVICHGDFAPYNVVINGGEATGIIDFDTAHPGPRIWDIAYALYRWAPFKNLSNPNTLGTLQEQVVRAKTFLDAYGLSRELRAALVDVMVSRLRALIDFMATEAVKGNETFQSHMQDGHHLTYIEDIEYLKTNHREIISVLVLPSSA